MARSSRSRGWPRCRRCPARCCRRRERRRRAPQDPPPPAGGALAHARGGGARAAVPARAHRPHRRRAADVGAGHGPVARDRRRLRHRGGAGGVRAVRRGAAGRARGRCHRHPRRRERPVSAERALLEAVLDARQLEALDYGYRERIWDTHLPHIRELPRVLPGLFAEAGRRAREAGFDGIELHYAHAYTMASFLSRLNTRDDGYGGPRAQRVRLPLEVLRAVRARVGGDYVVGIRYLGDDVVAGGSDVQDAAWFGARFAEAGVGYLAGSKGGPFEDAKTPPVGRAVYPYTGRSGYECMPTVLSDERGPFGRNVPLAARIRRSVNGAGFATPVITSGGIATFEQAEAILRNGEADIIAAARQSLADPDWFLKIRLGYGHLVRRCEFTNYCEGLDQQHKQVTCKLWDCVDVDAPEASLTRDGKRRSRTHCHGPP